MSFLYNSLLLFLALLYSPKAFYYYFFKGKYKKSLLQRFGGHFPNVDKKNKPLLWVHAVSVGETRAVIRLCKSLSAKYTLLISSTTETGQMEAKRSLPFADYHVFLPFDLSFIIRPIVKRVMPDLVILTETDFWFHFLKAAKENGAKTMLVNGKISEQSTKRLKFFPFFTKRLFSLVDFFCLQNALYKERFLSLGVPSSKIEVTGNLKFDDEKNPLNDEALFSWKKRLGITPKTKVLVIGSTHPLEETLLLDALSEVLDLQPDLKIILVPRHPERFDAVEKELHLKKQPFCRFSTKEECSERIVLLDAMGVLRACYQVADLAIVAGSFTEKVGGHNILEPILYGVPVLFGPHMFGQPDLLRLVLDYKAGIQLDHSQLSTSVNDLLNQPEMKMALITAGAKLMKETWGSTEKSLKSLQKII